MKIISKQDLIILHTLELPTYVFKKVLCFEEGNIMYKLCNKSIKIEGAN